MTGFVLWVQRGISWLKPFHVSPLYFSLARDSSSSKKLWGRIRWEWENENENQNAATVATKRQVDLKQYSKCNHFVLSDVSLESALMLKWINIFFFIDWCKILFEQCAVFQKYILSVSILYQYYDRDSEWNM